MNTLKTTLRVTVMTPLLALGLAPLMTSTASAQLSDDVILALSTFVGTTHHSTAPCYDCHPDPSDYQTLYKYAIPVSCLECHK